MCAVFVEGANNTVRSPGADGKEIGQRQKVQREHSKPETYFHSLKSITLAIHIQIITFAWPTLRSHNECSNSKILIIYAG